MKHFSTRQAFFMCSSTSDVEECTKILRFLAFLDDSGVAEILKNVKPLGTARPVYQNIYLLTRYDAEHLFLDAEPEGDGFVVEALHLSQVQHGVFRSGQSGHLPGEPLVGLLLF